MHVSSPCQGPRQSMRRPFAAVLMLALAGAGGVAHAAGFDEKLKAPMMKDSADLRTQAQIFATRYRAIRDATPAQLVTNVSLAKQQFDFSWQLERAVNERRPLHELESLGFESLDNGGYKIDTRQYPEWRSQGEYIATMFKGNLRDGVLAELLERGFRPEDVAALREYIESHDAKQAVRAATLPVALDFQKVVQKFDKAGRPVPDVLVVSYWYQSTREYFDANRAWSEGLLKTLDAQRQRVLISYLSELVSFKSVIPEDVEEGIRQTLASVRAPDFEKRAMATEGEVP
jgi:hypothetical protein